jgi:hypothetical protein
MHENCFNFVRKPTKLSCQKFNTAWISFPTINNFLARGTKFSLGAPSWKNAEKNRSTQRVVFTLHYIYILISYTFQITKLRPKTFEYGTCQENK